MANNHGGVIYKIACSWETVKKRESERATRRGKPKGGKRRTERRKMLGEDSGENQSNMWSVSFG